ncbi:MAG: DNA polymerase [Candidatus Hydrothermarchaeaceae archaeon]
MGPFIMSAVNEWMHQKNNYARLSALINYRGHTAMQTVTFRDQPVNPATVALAVLALQARGPPDQLNYRYILDITGLADGETRHVARTISRQDHQFISNLVTGLLTNQIDGLTLDSPELSESDREIRTLMGEMDVLQVRILRVGRYEPLPTWDDDTHETPTQFFAGAPGVGSGSFFGYWLDEIWPEDLSMIQVYKKSQQKGLGSDKIKIEGAFFELGCLANSFLVQGMEVDRLREVMEIISGTANPNFPTSCLKQLSTMLKINIRCVLYDRRHRSRGRRVADYMGGGIDDVWYLLGRIENHFVPDIESGWGRKAAGNYVAFREKLGESLHGDIPLDRIKKAYTVEYDHGSAKRLKIVNRQKTMTYGELLCILVYGVESKEGQSPMVTMMEAEDYCLKASLYARFKKRFAARDLPAHKSEEEMDEWIRASSKEMTKRRQVLLNDHFGTRSYPLGAALGYSYVLKDDRGKSIYGRKGYSVIDDHHRRMGHVVESEWCFRDKYVLTTGCMSADDRLDWNGSCDRVLFDAKQWYTVMCMDSETYCSTEVDPETGAATARHRPYMFCVSYLEDEGGRVVNFRELDEELKATDASASSFYDRIIGRTTRNIVPRVRTFRGHGCAQELCDFFASPKFEDYHLHVISHNAHYDINMLIGFSDAIITAGIIKSASRLNTVTVESGGKITYHQCSYAVTGIPLKDFAETFNLDVSKEYMPYDVYTEENLFEPGMRFASECKMDARMPTEDAWKSAGAPTLEEFEKSVQKSNEGLICPTTEFNLWRYAAYYCALDCEVLMKGFLNLRYELYHLPIPIDGMPEELWGPCKLDIIHAASLPQYASYYLGTCGAFEGVFQFKGSIREYISRAVVGGKCMMMGNSPTHIHEEYVEESSEADEAVEIDDFDACSLYPAAMDRISKEGKGFTTGLPKFVNLTDAETDEGTFEIPALLATAHQFFASVRVWELARPLAFPIISTTSDEEHEEDGGRYFTNHPNGAAMVIDRVTYEDLVAHHEGARVEFKQALYWEAKDGGNTRIGTVVQYLYRSRMELKARGKGAAQQARKLTMNSAYGRMIMKPVEKKLFFIEGEDKIYHYIARHSTSMATANFIRPDFAVVERHMPVFEHYSTPHLGGHVLSMAKRIMNEVTTLAHDLGIHIYYMDTDSMHIPRRSIPVLSKAFFDKYGRKLVVTPGEETTYTAATEEMGRFHSDFKGMGKEYTPPVSVDFIVIGKKAYYDRLMVHEKSILEGERTPDNATYYDHIRMKGIPTRCIEKHAEDRGVTVRSLFVNLLAGESIVFELVEGSIRFEMTKAFETRTRSSFKRTIRLNMEKVERAREDWKKNGWSSELFPFDRGMALLPVASPSPSPSPSTPVPTHMAGMCLESIPFLPPFAMGGEHTEIIFNEEETDFLSTLSPGLTFDFLEDDAETVDVDMVQ